MVGISIVETGGRDGENGSLPIEVIRADIREAPGLVKREVSFAFFPAQLARNEVQGRTQDPAHHFEVFVALLYIEQLRTASLRPDRRLNQSDCQNQTDNYS